MKLCFDATRFGTGLEGAIELAASKGVPSIEYKFEPFPATGKQGKSLKAKERSYLEQLADQSREKGVELACLNLDYVHVPGDKRSAKKFQGMLTKLARVAGVVGCQRVSFFIQPEPARHPDWKAKFEEEYRSVEEEFLGNNVKPLLSLSTPMSMRTKSLKKWCAMEPQDWRDLLSVCSGLSLGFSPADCVWLGIDYLSILSGFASAIEHVEGHDVEINRHVLRDSGMFGPLWWRYRIAGRGAVDWRQLIELLKLYDYKGTVSIKLDDEFLADDASSLEDALDEGMRTIGPLVRD